MLDFKNKSEKPLRIQKWRLGLKSSKKVVSFFSKNERVHECGYEQGEKKKQNWKRPFYEDICDCR